MNLNLFKDIRNAYKNLKPGGTRDLAEKPVSIGVLASSEEKVAYIKDFLGPSESRVARVTDDSPVSSFNLILAEPDFPRPSGAYEFRFHNPEWTIHSILDDQQELEVALARNYPAFREEVVDRIVRRTSKENALFAMISALPNVVPSFLELPWVIGEFTSDTAFITMNQVRMAFLVAASNDHNIGYEEQKVELGTIVLGAFGWRSLARNLVSRIPLGGGLIPKAAIAYAGTYVVGKGLDKLHRTGRGFDKQERQALYDAAVEKGKQVAGQIVESVKNRNAA